MRIRLAVSQTEDGVFLRLVSTSQLFLKQAQGLKGPLDSSLYLLTFGAVRDSGASGKAAPQQLSSEEELGQDFSKE